MGETTVIFRERMATLAEAASYCRLTKKEFEAQFPYAAVEFTNGKRRYDKVDIDKWINELKTKNTGPEQPPIDRAIEQL